MEREKPKYTEKTCSVINNLAIIVIHTTYNNLLFTDFYDDMFRSLYDNLQVVSPNFGLLIIDKIHPRG